MLRLLALVALVWLILLPPLFTGGACTREFDEEAARLEQDRKSLATPALAAAYWSGRQIPHSRVSVDQCRRAKPRDLPSCGAGPIVYAAVPVRHAICRLYRDGEIRVRLQYDERDRLEQSRLDMSPYRSLPLPFGGGTLHWAR